MKIVIDAGHGGRDSGAVNGGLYEKAAALAVAKILKDKLIKAGHNIIMTRETDIFIELQDRCKISNSNKADLFISLHCNSATNSTAQGIETWYYTTSAKGKDLASKIQGHLIKNTNAKDRGIKAGTFYVIKNTRCPAVLVEMGFIGNNDEKKLLFKTYYQNLIADAVLSGIKDFCK